MKRILVLFVAAGLMLSGVGVAQAAEQKSSWLNAANDLCLDWGPQPGYPAPVAVTTPCDPSRTSQDWKEVDAGGGYYWLISWGWCARAEPTAGSVPTQGHCDSVDRELWQRDLFGYGRPGDPRRGMAFHWRNKATGLCMKGGPRPGTNKPVTMQPCNDPAEYEGAPYVGWASSP